MSIFMIEQENPMAFIKNSIAIGEPVTISDEDVQAMQEKVFPTDPEVGAVHEGFVWDGETWITVEVWTARQQQIPDA